MRILIEGNRVQGGFHVVFEPDEGEALYDGNLCVEEALGAVASALYLGDTRPQFLRTRGEALRWKAVHGFPGEKEDAQKELARMEGGAA